MKIFKNKIQKNGFFQFFKTGFKTEFFLPFQFITGFFFQTGLALKKPVFSIQNRYITLLKHTKILKKSSTYYRLVWF